MKAKIYYHDIGDYLDREEKLRIVKRFGSFANPEMIMQELQPNEHGDWVSVRNAAFENWIPLEPGKKFDGKAQSFFIAQSLGSVSARDAWVYNFSLPTLKANISKTIAHYNTEREYVNTKKQTDVNTNSTLGSWSRDWQNNLKRNKAFEEKTDEYRKALHRPFLKFNFYFDDDLNQERYQLPKLFPSEKLNNLVICVTGAAASKPFSVLMTDTIPNLDTLEKAQCFPLYYYEESNATQKGLFDSGTEQQYTRRDGISDFILQRAQKQYGKNVSKEDIFYYVYGFLHSPEYRETFAADLKKMLPRLPLVESVKDFWAFSKAGRALAELHLNYESIPPHPEVVTLVSPLGISGNMQYANEAEAEHAKYRVQKMRFPKKGQKDSIIYNSQITVENIPEKAYGYVVNGKGAVEWIMERYQITTHKESGITNDPNDWAMEHGKPRYILDLLLSIINVSCQTVDIVAGLPKVEFALMAEE